MTIELKQTFNLTIPFQGFYESWYSSDINNNIDSEADYYHDKKQLEKFGDTLVERSFIWDAIYDNADYSAMHQEFCQSYVDSFNLYIKDESGTDLGLVFETMTSPKEYNFTTDKIFCNINRGVMIQLFNDVKLTPNFKATIKDKFTSRDGFISFYSNNVEDWLEKSIEDYDHNELGTILEAWIDLKELDSDNDFAFKIYELVNGDSYEIVSDNIDWDKVDETIQDKRQELIEDMGEDYTPIEPRCPATLELTLVGGKNKN